MDITPKIQAVIVASENGYHPDSKVSKEFVDWVEFYEISLEDVADSFVNRFAPGYYADLAEIRFNVQ